MLKLHHLRRRLLLHPSIRQLGLITEVDVSLRIMRLIQAFRVRGHFAASLDPLSSSSHTININTSNETKGSRKHIERKAAWLPDDPQLHPDIVKLLRKYPELDLTPFDLQDVPLDKKFFLADEVRSELNQKYYSIREIVDIYRRTYCSNVGVEITHIESAVQRKWLLEQFGNVYGPRRWSTADSKEKKRTILQHLIRCDRTAIFFGKKFPSAKVFGLEGGESVVPGLWSVLERSSRLGVEGVELGMAHRGRMNILHNIFGISLSSICNKFSESEINELGDVKYHLGTRAEVKIRGMDDVERRLHLSLAANPSHLESVNAVVLGKTKAKQFYIQDLKRSKVMPVLLHGDASFSGQGIVPESLELSDLPDYDVGGCVHIIVNNQIGFTTEPRLARTSYHCTNAAKGVGAPVFHVNGDDVEAVVAVCELAASWRERFHKDCVVDIVCFRRHGHNSLDDPRSTQPLTCQLIDNHPSVLDIYVDQLVEEGVVSRDEVKSMTDALWESYEKDYCESTHYTADPTDWLASNWQGAAIGSLVSQRPYNQTGVETHILDAVGRALTVVPKDFKLHKDVEKLLAAREKMIESGQGITMAFAEQLAFGCLMHKYNPKSGDGLRGVMSDRRNLSSQKDWSAFDVTQQEHPSVHIRLSGQDSVRGTFNQRHSTIVCQETGREYSPLNNLSKNTDNLEFASITVCNSNLSEAAVLAFEYGYSLSNEMALVIWEAQFGDFANVAQSIIDNYIVSGEPKWNNRSALVLLLPHGFDGQGPEHSSARLERFLQLVDDDPDEIPGNGEFSKEEIESGFKLLDTKREGKIDRKSLVDAIMKYVPNSNSERVDLTLAELLGDMEGVSSVGITKTTWMNLMQRWLQMNSERRHNIIVVCPSTPAQYFHCLRRQIHRPFAKPLVIMSPKWLLHHKPCISDLADMATGTYFQRLILEDSKGDNMKHKSDRLELVYPDQIKRVLFCSGKMFYHLYHARNAANIRNITIVRVEQIAPFPYHLVGPAIAKFLNARLFWVQEEPKNQGAWSYVKPRFDTTLRENDLHHDPIKYIGRKPSASAATGAYKVHTQEQKEIVEVALGLK